MLSCIELDMSTVRAGLPCDSMTIHHPRPGEKLPPQMVLLNAILAGGDEFPTDLEYRRKGNLKIGRFRQVQTGGGYEHLKGLRPGDQRVTSSPSETFRIGSARTF
jgi:hypothetical protein